MTKRCLYCDRELVRRNLETFLRFAARTFCARKCSVRYRYGVNLNSFHESKPCAQCGGPIKRGNLTSAQFRDRVVCSRACSEARSSAMQTVAETTATCGNCAKPFQVTHHRQRAKFNRGGIVFCSRACGAKPYLADKAGWYVVQVAKTVGFMPYVDRPYASEEEARGIIRDLMKGYPADSEWWNLLSVRWLDAKCSKKAAA